jgi:hypothetical protein
MIALSPLDSTIERVKQIAPWVGLGLIITEALFIGGLALMAWSVGIRLGPNPLQWRARMDAILARLNSSPLFWAGLALNTIGAIGTGVVVVVAITAGLPTSAWGLLVLPLGDLTLTAAVRGAVISGVRRNVPPPSAGRELADHEGTTNEDPPLHR